jgi:glycosyltransferase involved in cell wall biosynthesis
MLISYIIPVYNGESTLIPLFQKINEANEKLQYNFEVIFIWDCGPDKSWEVIESLKKEYPDKIKAIHLSKNFGQHNAIICGFEYANGDFIVTMDEDLQHDPYEVEKLIKKQKENESDVVYGHYPNKSHNKFRNITYIMLKKLQKTGIPDLYPHYSPYRLIKKDIAKSCIGMQNSYTFLDGYLSWITTNISSVEVSHNERHGGKSSYNLKKLISHSINIFVTFSNLPIKIVTWLSMLFFIFTTGYGIFVLVQKLFLKNMIPGYASMMVLLGLGIGSILFGISVLGEYIHRINLKTTKRPNYSISKKL